MNKINTAVIGVGSLGQHHARILASHPQSNLIAVVDVDEKRRKKLAAQHGAADFAEHLAVQGLVRAAVVSVPTPLHYGITKDLLSWGIHCLVEKPFTATVKEAEELIALARDNNLILQVGHIERFNPAVLAARQYIKSPRFIEVNRLGPYDPRTSHIGVVLDLMIHDLDIVLNLVGGEKVLSLEAYGAKVLSDFEDIAKIRLKFANGCVADLSASRISLEKYRKIRIFQPDSYISIDYAGKSLKIYKKKYERVAKLTDIDVIKPKLKDSDMLTLELTHFLTCVTEGKQPLVTGEHGRDALELAFEILKNMQY